MINNAVPWIRAQCILRRQCQARLGDRRGLAAAASGSFNYQVGDASGLKFASRDLPGPTTHLAVVAKAGSRYQPLPGWSDGLEQYAFKGTWKRSALRITREAELLGAVLESHHSRENLIIGAKFLREDLPYFVELLGEVISQTKYMPYEYHEQVEPVIKLRQKSLLANTEKMAINSAHGVAFHKGLGTPIHPVSSSPMKNYLGFQEIEAYSQVAYVKPNIAVVANGASHEDLTQWVNQFFSETRNEPQKDVPSLYTAPTKYYGGEERIAHASGNSMILAFPGSGAVTGPSAKPEMLVLAALLGGQSSIKWSPGFSLLSRAVEAFSQVSISTDHHTYTDAGLMTISLSGSAQDIRKAAGEVVKVLKSVAAGNIKSEDVKKAVASAKFKALDAGQNISTGLELTGAGLIQNGKPYQLDDLAKIIEGVKDDQVKKAAKSLLEGKATVSAVGDLYVLPWAEEIGLQV